MKQNFKERIYAKLSRNIKKQQMDQSVKFQIGSIKKLTEHLIFVIAKKEKKILFSSFFDELNLVGLKRKSELVGSSFSEKGELLEGLFCLV